MYNLPYYNPYYYFYNDQPAYSPYRSFPIYQPEPLWVAPDAFDEDRQRQQLKDYGPEPFVINIEEAAERNRNFRTALWTGKHFQITLMSLRPGEDIGLEMHPNVDQFLRIEQGQGIVRMGKERNNLNFVRRVHEDYAIVVPAGTWHNLTNTGNEPLKLYSIYAPPNHPHGTVHQTKAAALAAEEHHNQR